MQLLYHFKLKILLTKTYILLIRSGVFFSPPSLFGKQIRAYTYSEVLYTNYGIEKVSKEINMKSLNSLLYFNTNF